ncbi:hypothetical protein LA303_09355 [Candidatus Sulfidibacterium hydrothermale]|uniref:hypothetical protein n=1 Tax=Candidatus Sulfidibacterium hydrothermale TaxID=2875962 RepID=UPI001F0A770F|nr:hypothetical protein [Candidatus Sulfidibacterium hydrothermale]UBM61619.1 hypothetical protein LA303_09355 [Candidatus Sulfidibacterium hydrothermale]
MKSYARILFLTVAGVLFFSFPAAAQYQNLTHSDSSKNTQHVGQVERISPYGKKARSSNGGGFFFGGGLGGGYSTYSSYIQITPIIGYRVTSQFQVGTRLTYMHQWYKDYMNNKYNYDIYGGSLFVRYIFWKSLYAQAEYEVLSVPDYYSADQDASRTINSFFAGLGFMQSMGGRAFMYVSVLYNFLEDQYTPYSNPLVRVGFGVGL